MIRPFCSTRRIAYFFIAVELMSGITAFGLGGKVKPKEDPRAQDLAGSIKPLGLTSKADPAGINAAKKQIGDALTKMEKSTATGGPGAEQLVLTAYTKFLPMVGPTQRSAAAATLSAMWREARALGCFDDNHQFTGRITKGTDVGKEVVYEFIVPLEQAPEFSRDLANIRLVTPSEARKTDDKPTPRDLAWLTTLNSISREVKGLASVKKIEERPKGNAVGQTKQEALRIFTEEMYRNKDTAKDKPSILLKGTLASMPAKGTAYKWRVQAEVSNLSAHATEAELQVYVVGTTHKFHKPYVMITHKQKLQLRSGEVQKLFFDTLDKNTYKSRTDDLENLDPKKERPHSLAHYRGTLFRVMHDKDVCAEYATEDALLTMFNSEGAKEFASLPNLQVDPKAKK